MSYAKILLPMTGAPRDAGALSLALAAANAFGGHVQALFVRPDPSEALPYLGEGASAGIIQDIISAAREASDKAAASAKQMATDMSQAAGITMLDRPRPSSGPTLSFHVAQGRFADTVVRESRLCDLVVMPRPDADDTAGLSAVFETCLLTGQRPVLLAPEAEAARAFPTKIALAWDGGATAANAVRAALPLLRQAESVVAVAVGHPAPDRHGLQALTDYLALHAIEASDRVVDPGDRAAGEVLLEAAAHIGAELLVMGGYGHSRLRELILGGVTRHVLAGAGLPVFLAH